jgi:molybdopterin-guanine dinucleotide biosynthesis protein A
MMGGVIKKVRCGGKPMTAVVLAGGRGSRMKADKARLKVGGRTLLEHVLAQVDDLFDEVLVSVSAGRKSRLPAAIRAKARYVEDEKPGLGPLGGIAAALKAARNEACAVIACDIPDIDLPLLRSLARTAGPAEIAVPVGPTGHPEPLFAVYRRTIVPEIEALLRANERSILPLYERCRTAVVGFKDPGRLRNLNTREDYEAYLRSLGQRPGRTTKP